ncbi:MAG: hypothetical protein RL701_2761 [Pseudomonadota bacterium]|jgi:hypothetical protein
MGTSTNERTPRRRRTGRDDESLVSDARRIVKLEMERRGFNFKRLAGALDAMGDEPTESVQTLINKVNRGRFSFAFFLRVSRAMGMTAVDVTPLPVAPTGKPNRDARS